MSPTKARVLSSSLFISVCVGLSTATAALLCSPASASPWVEPGNWELRHHIEVLVDSGAMTLPLASWPVTWQSIDQSLQQLDQHTLTDSQIASYHYLKHALQQALSGLQIKQLSHLSGSRTALKGFDRSGREAIENTIGIDVLTDNFAANIQVSRIGDPLDNEKTRADGSYIAGILDNWVLGVGAIDRWWGPGWQSSLILSDNARPAPGLFIQRNSAEAFETPYLSWIGPWQLTSFVNQLEGNRDVPHALFWGVRANIRPIQSLELGFSRTALLGGRGRPESLHVLTNVILGNDNTNSGGIANDGSNEPGDQLAGFDARWSWQYTNISGAVYAQLIGEDEAGHLPSRNIGLLGFEASTDLWKLPSRFIFEASNTHVGFEQSPKIENYAYEHHIYFNGYRFQGRPIGASSDNDSETYSLRGLHFLEQDQAIFWTLTRSIINGDGTNASSPGGNIFGGTAHHETYADLGYQLPIGETLKIEFALNYFQTPLHLASDTIDSGGYINISSLW